MDKFVTVIKPARSSLKEKEKCTNSSRFTPYPASKPKNFPDEMSKSNYPEAVAQDKARLRQCVSLNLLAFLPTVAPYRLLAPLKKDGTYKPSAREITKHLLNTLADESNPITHSNIYERSGAPIYHPPLFLSYFIVNFLNYLQIMLFQPHQATSAPTGVVADMAEGTLTSALRS
jgi:hypothetical protein